MFFRVREPALCLVTTRLKEPITSGVTFGLKLAKAVAEL
jgi:hypothetical protein